MGRNKNRKKSGRASTSQPARHPNERQAPPPPPPPRPPDLKTPAEESPKFVYDEESKTLSVIHVDTLHVRNADTVHVGDIHHHVSESGQDQDDCDGSISYREMEVDANIEPINEPVATGGDVAGDIKADPRILQRLQKLISDCHNPGEWKNNRELCFELVCLFQHQGHGSLQKVGFGSVHFFVCVKVGPDHDAFLRACTDGTLSRGLTKLLVTPELEEAAGVKLRVRLDVKETSNTSNVSAPADRSVDGGVAGWVSKTGAGMQPRIGAPGADRLSGDDDFDKKSLLRKVEVCTPSESSAIITKNMDIESDLADEVSMVSSAMSQSDYSMSVKKDSKFDGSGSGSEKPSELRSTGLTDYLEQLKVDRTPDPSVDGGVAEWLRAGMQPRIGAPGADRLSDIRPSIGHLETLKLEDYQVELAEPALQGHNTCVVAPTGSGKTYVAVAVAQEVLRKSPGKKVIFVVNQVPLVHQQSTVFKKYIKDVAYICGDHGQPQITRLPMDQVLRKNDVVVLTAQILVDALTKGQVSFKQIGIIVFDECHETKKESQYNAIMAKYMEQKLDNKKPLPQILGMTASLGVGNARSDKNAIQYMLKICANMDVVKLSTVEKHKESLEKVNKPEEGLHVVTSRTEDSFAEEIQDLMYQVFKYINSSTGSSVLTTTVEKLSSLRSSNHSRENFSHVLCKLKKEIAENSKSKDLQLGLMTCAQYLKEYSSALAIHETARTKDALQFLQEFIKEKSNKAVTTNTEKILIRTFQEKQQELERISMSPKSPNNPALDELQSLIERDIVTCQAQENNGPFRAILFTQTIASTWALQKWVMDTDSLKDLHPEVLVGCRNPGMNLRHQTDVLDNFRNGVHKLLIATSVIQQGIDIPACNFVYRYNYITDAVARIQARGRTRKPGGRFDLVVHDYRGLDGKDKLSKEQEQIMQQATDAVSSLSIEEMILGTAEYQQHRNVQVFNQQRPKPFDECNHSYHCKHCDALVCHSADIRIVPGGHHVVIHRQIFSKIRIVPSGGNVQDPGHWSSVEHAKKEIRCADERCDTKLGSILKCNNRMLLAFSIKSLRLRSEAGKTKTNKSWGSLPFIFQKVPVTEASFALHDILGTVA